MNKALNPIEVEKIAGTPIKTIRYVDLINYKSLKEAFGNFKAILLLYHVASLNNGHWVCLVKRPHEISFFDPYGFMPDDQLQFTNVKFRKENGINMPYLTYLLYKSKLPVDYNDKQIQKFADNIQTCGRHCGNFIRIGKSNKQYTDLWKGIPKNKIDELIVIIYW